VYFFFAMTSPSHLRIITQRWICFWGSGHNEILNLDIYDEKGKPVPALVKLVLKAMEQIEGRLLGFPVHRSENKNLNVLFNPPQEPPAQRYERLRQEISERRKQFEEDFHRRHHPAEYVVPGSQGEDL
jgi:hypothetical protein